MKLLRLSVFLILIVPVVAAAQSKKIPVSVSHSGQDPVGQGVAFGLKEAIRASHSFTLVDDELVPKTDRIKVVMVSVDMNDQVDSAIAIALLLKGPKAVGGMGELFVTMGAWACGQKHIETCAKDMLVRSDRQIEPFRKIFWP